MTFIRVEIWRGFFALNPPFTAYPSEPARWAHVLHFEVATDADAVTAANVADNFFRRSEGDATFTDRIRWGKVLTLDTSKNALNQSWFWQTIYDNAGGLMTAPIMPPGTFPRGYTTSGNFPFPPSLALRFKREPETTLAGRGAYGYIRGVDTDDLPAASSAAWGNALPDWSFSVSTSTSRHLTVPLSGSGLEAYHGMSGSTPREVILAMRSGTLQIHGVDSYEHSGYDTSTRNFKLNW